MPEKFIRISIDSKFTQLRSYCVMTLSVDDLEGNLVCSMDEFEEKLANKLFSRFCLLTGVEKKYPNANINICIEDQVLDTIEITSDAPLTSTDMDSVLQELFIFATVWSRKVCKLIPYHLLMQGFLTTRK